MKAIESKITPLSRNAKSLKLLIMKQTNFHTRDKIQGWKTHARQIKTKK